MNEVALFWLVLCAFLVADNLVLLPPGGDYLRLDAAGRLRYEPGQRLEARGRGLLLLNPLNAFSFVIPTTRAMAGSAPVPWRAALRDARALRRAVRVLGWIGSAYLLAIAAALVLTWHLHFGAVLLLLLAAHLLAWSAAAMVLWRQREAFGLTPARAWGLMAEALFVPSHTVHLGKRAAHRQAADLPALNVGLRALRRMPEGPDRDLFVHGMLARVDDWQAGSPSGNDARRAQEIRQCLKALMPPAGS